MTTDFLTLLQVMVLSGFLGGLVGWTIGRL